jgi:hypothetical protein
MIAGGSVKLPSLGFQAHRLLATSPQETRKESLESFTLEQVGP